MAEPVKQGGLDDPGHKIYGEHGGFLQKQTSPPSQQYSTNSSHQHPITQNFLPPNPFIFQLLIHLQPNRQNRSPQGKKAPRKDITMTGGGTRSGNPRLLYVAGYDQRPQLDRGRPETYTRSCGTQPAYQSLIHRRLLVPPPAMRDSLEPSSNPRCRGRTTLPRHLENGHEREQPGPTADSAPLLTPHS